jgi:CubicO group peptidase (beta-lactamase class C family)
MCLAELVLTALMFLTVCVLTVQPDTLKGAFSEVMIPGVGFGLGFSVVKDVAAMGQIGSPGSFSWGGAASTYFFIDPVEDLAVVYSTQVMNRDDHVFPRNGMLMAMVYGALDDSGSRRRPPFSKL